MDTNPLLIRCGQKADFVIYVSNACVDSNEAFRLHLENYENNFSPKLQADWVLTLNYDWA